MMLAPRGRVHSALAATTLTFAMILITSTASADDPATPTDDDLSWRPEWEHAHPNEYMLALTFGALALASNELPVASRDWGRNDLDEAVRDHVRVRDPATRDALRQAGDVVFYSLMAYPLFDSLVVSAPRSGEVGLQTTVLNAQSLGLSAFTSIFLARTTGRERPFVRECGPNGDPGYAEDCAGTPEERNKSFPSGHALMAFTGAGLVCAHHSQLPIYGGGPFDAVACGVAVSAASFEATTRLMADRHYFTDVVVGSVFGFASGFVLPMVLHYERGDDDPLPAPLPMARPQVSYAGRF